jgi:Rho-binding antiterminator
MKAYQPINCNYYDELEALATLRKKVVLEYYGSSGEKQSVESRIVNLYTRTKEEFMELEDGIVFRLDRLIRADGKLLQLSC